MPERHPQGEHEDDLNQMLDVLLGAMPTDEDDFERELETLKNQKPDTMDFWDKVIEEILLVAEMEDEDE